MNQGLRLVKLMKQEETSSHEAEDDREVVCDDVIGERHDE